MALVCLELFLEAMLAAEVLRLRAVEIPEGKKPPPKVGENCGKGPRRRVKSKQQECRDTVDGEP